MNFVETINSFPIILTAGAAVQTTAISKPLRQSLKKLSNHRRQSRKEDLL
jgi:hypothetical protein